VSRTRISIVTPSLDQARFIERTIESVLSQRGDFDLEYLVVDGQSTDGTLEILRRAGERLRFVSEPDRGQADAINKGLRAATGEILAWLNSDDLLLPGTLDRVARTLAENRRAQWLHSECEIIDEDGRPIRSWISRYKDWRCRRYSYRSLLGENFISQMTVFWRREAMQAVGLLDDSLRFAFDYDFWLRLGRLGDPLYLQEKLAAFRWYETSKSGATFSKQFAEDYRVFLRHAPPDPLLRFRKRLRNSQIVAAYRLMAALRATKGEA
jgi:glycosyltransferase involved in cell wall biosynthesis